MKNIRHTCSRFALAATASLMISTSISAQEVENVKWAVPISFSSTLTALGDTLPWVAKRVEKVSGGKIQFEIFEPNALIPALSIFEAAATGQIDAGYSWMGYERGQIPASALYGATPFGLEPAQFIAWMYEGEGDALLKEVFAPYGVYPILCGTVSPESAGWFKFPIESVDQLAGLKYRASGLTGEVMEEVGMSVTVIAAGEIYQALETGVIDAAEFSLPTVDKQLGFQQVAKFYHLPGWQQPATSQFLYVNQGVWDSLNPTTQSLIETTCMAGVTYAMARSEALQGPVLKEFAAEGVEARRLPEDVLQTLRDATGVVMKRESEKDEMFAKVYNSMMAFKESNSEWNELGYLPRDWKWENEADFQ